jgi:glycolate oxidase FAD binding subunit
MRLLPSSEAELGEAVAAAAASRAPLLVEGNGTKAPMLRPVQAARTLSTAALSGITLYRPQELVLSARAGTPVAEIEAALAAQGQHLISEPYDLAPLLGAAAAPTLGGMVATNLSGPRRISWGATRDHVLGVRAVDGAGAIFHSGGRVLKNVTGLDLCKLLTGSFGTLAVLSEITLKVLPAPETTASVLVEGVDAAAGVVTLSAALGSPYGVSAAAFLPGRGAIARLEDVSDSIAYRAPRLAADLGGRVLDDSESRALWAAIRRLEPLGAHPEDAVWKVSVRPSAGPRVLAAAPRGFLDWGGGLAWLAGPATAEQHATVTQAARQARGSWQVVRAPDALRAAVDAIPPEPPALAAIAARVKAVMDPHFILNPGRMRAGQ